MSLSDWTAVTRRGAARAAVFRWDIIANPGLSVPLGLAALAWIHLAVVTRQQGGLDLCIGGHGSLGRQVSTAFSAQWTILQPGMLWTWCVMVVAMMMPLVSTHLSIAVAQTAPCHKWLALLGALCGYLAVWVALAGVYVPLFLLAQTLDSLNLRVVSAGLLYGLAILWCFSPIRTKALRAAHMAPLFFGSGRQHLVMAMRWGAWLASICALTCFLAMAAPMLAGQGLVGMLLMTYILLLERRAIRPTPPLVAGPLVAMGVLAMVKAMQLV